MSRRKRSSDVAKAYENFESSGNENALLDAVLTYFNRLSTQFSCPVAMADDVNQEALLKVWRSLHLYNPRKSGFSTWTYTVWSNTRLNYIRDQKTANKGLVSLEEYI